LALEIGTGARPLVELNANNKNGHTCDGSHSASVDAEAIKVVPEAIVLNGDNSVHSDFNPQSGESDEFVWWNALPGDNSMDIRCPPLSVFYDIAMAGYISDLLHDDVIGEWDADGYSDFEPQSGKPEELGNMMNAKNARYENVAFTEQHEPSIYDTASTVDPTRKVQDTEDATLQHFFGRPIKIQEFQWDTGATLFQQFNPWENYFDNPRVINRITNYNLLRAKLKVKLVINGSGFHYGRAICSYLPFAGGDTLSSNDVLYSEDIVQASQQPHVYLNPTTSHGGEITCPFFWYKNWLNVPDEDWTEMGQMTLRSMTTLGHANGATDKCTISVFAWAEDVEMAVLTSDEPASLVAQSGVENEVDQANKSGVVSGPATAVANFAGALAQAPIIGPFAKATQMGAAATADIAKLFGYSRPAQTENPTGYKPTATSSMALGTVPDGVQKLTLDDKQELSIDPRLSGVGGADNLSIKSIAQRESYIGQWTWVEGTAPETAIGSLRVDPCIYADISRGGNVAASLPACAVAALPFKYWTGSMKFRFQICCSNFHKGRLKIVYDPNTQASNEYNTNFTQIIDIADRTDFTVEVGNGQERTLLTHCEPIADAATTVFTISSTPLTAQTYGNGSLTCYIVNELTSPTTAAQTIKINVFACAGEDFEVFVPNDDIANYVFKPQIGMEPQSGLVDMKGGLNAEEMNAEEESAPVHTLADSLGPGKTIDQRLNLVYSGEKIESFRQLLKRYNLSQALCYVDNAAIARIITGRRSAYPMLRGNVTNAVHTRAGPASYNFANTVLLHWVTKCFSGWRGAIRWKLIPRGDYDEFSPVRLEVQRSPEITAEYAQATNGALFYGSLSQAAHSAVHDNSSGIPSANKPFTGLNGMAVSTSNVNPTLEFEMPFYSQYRFEPGKVQDYTLVGDYTESWDYRAFARANTNFTIDAYCAAGEDLQCYMWTGMPPLYRESAPPAAV